MSLSEVSELSDGYEIFQTGQASNQFFIVIEGKVAIRTGPQQERTEIAQFRSGDCFGELEFFTGDKRTASAVCVGSTLLLAFPRDISIFSDFSEQWSAVNAHLFHGFLKHISSRIRRANVMVKDNTPLVRGLRRQAYEDKLTGLNNKAYLEETLRKLLQEGTRVGLLMWKPDNFKLLNDSYGHDAGDKILKFTGGTVQNILPDPDMLFRYMGNENAVIIPDANRAILQEYADLIGNCLRNLDLSSVIKDSQFRFSVSFGLALSPEHGSTNEELIQCAHTLVMEGRSHGGNSTLFPEDSN